MARPNARQQENTESIQIPAFHYVLSPCNQWYCFVQDTGGLWRCVFPTTLLCKDTSRQLGQSALGSLGLCDWHQLFSIYDSHSRPHSRIIYHIQVHGRDIKKWHLLLLLLRWIHSCQHCLLTQLHLLHYVTFRIWWDLMFTVFIKGGPAFSAQSLCRPESSSLLSNHKNLSSHFFLRKNWPQTCRASLRLNCERPATQVRRVYLSQVTPSLHQTVFM